jgi:hypothetical protein
MVNLSITKRTNEGARQRGQMTRDTVYGIIADASMPLTINEINSLYKGTRGKSLTREYLRIVLDELVEAKKLSTRLENPAERKLRGSSRGSNALLFFVPSARIKTRTKLPKVPFKLTWANSSSAARTMKKKSSKSKTKAKAGSTPSANDLINALIADRTKDLEARIARLETKLSRIKAIANK